MAFGKKDQNEKQMTNSDARELILEWADSLDVNTETEMFESVIDELVIPVKKERLIFNPMERNFTYKLFEPIQKQDGDKIEMITIRATTLNEKKIIQRFKESESVDKATALLALSCDIESGFASRIKDFDMSPINAVILGFFVKATRSQ